MKRFLLKVVLFISFFAIPFFFMEVYIYWLNSTIKIKSNYLKKNLKTIEVLILGSSHNECAINPNYLSVKSANCAYGGQDLSLDYKILYKYLPKLKNLKLVIIELAYHRLEFKRRNDYWRIPLYIRHYGITDFEAINILDWSIFYSNPIFYLNYILQKINPNSFKAIINKYGFVENNFPGRFYDLCFNGQKIWDSRSKSRGKKQSVENFKYNSNILNKMLAYCRQKNIAVIFVSPPVYKTYYSEMVLDKKKRRNEFLKDHSDVTFLNYESSNFFNIRDFKDDDHMNSNGAIKFTKLLDAHIALLLPKDKEKTTNEKNIKIEK